VSAHGFYHRIPVSTTVGGADNVGNNFFQCNAKLPLAVALVAPATASSSKSATRPVEGQSEVITHGYDFSSTTRSDWPKNGFTIPSAQAMGETMNLSKNRI
jgi:hypothetical protein